MNSTLACKKLGSQQLLLTRISPRGLEIELNDTVGPTLKLVLTIRSLISVTGCGVSITTN
jgi:hypothetical protein